MTDSAALRYVDSEIDEIVEITDGDTIRAFLERDEPYDEHARHTIYTDRVIFPRGVSLRLVHVDCPDYPDRVGKAAAKADTTRWITYQRDRGQLYVRTWYGGGFGRYLADIYVLDEAGNEESLSQWLLTDANNEKGWPPYVGRA